MKVLPIIILTVAFNVQASAEGDVAGHHLEDNVVDSSEKTARMEPELAENMSRKKRGTLLKKISLWPKNETIYYGYNETYPESAKAWIRNVLSQISENTCLNTVEKNDGFRNVLFYQGEICQCAVGWPGHNYTRYISINMDCMYGVFHEFFHNLGMGHTQRRGDRDNYITVATYYDEGKYYPEDEFHLDPPAPYDFKSIMHYGGRDYKNNGTLVILPHERDYLYTIGNNIAPTFSDYKQINMRYMCGEECPSVKCENGGYQHPRNCNQCVCTEFHSGARCEKFEGVILSAGENKTITDSGPFDRTLFDAEIMRELTTEGDYNKFKKFKPIGIKGPDGKKLRVTLTKIAVLTKAQYIGCKTRCHQAAIEIIDNPSADLTVGGKMYRCDHRTGDSFVTHTNVIGYRGWAAPGWDHDFIVTVEVEP